MCGLIAWVGEMPTDVAEMAFLSGGRGPHQHGFATLRTHFETTKRMGPLSGPFVDDKGEPFGDFTIGHSRLATSGSRSGDLPPLEEAQPYIDLWGELVIAHNGTIYLEENSGYNDEVDTTMLFDLEESPHEFLAFHRWEYDKYHALITATKEKMMLGSYGQPLFYRVEPKTVSVSSVPTKNGNWLRVWPYVEIDRDGKVHE